MKSRSELPIRRIVVFVGAGASAPAVEADLRGASGARRLLGAVADPHPLATQAGEQQR